MAVPAWYSAYLKKMHPDPKVALEIGKLQTKALKVMPGSQVQKKILEEIKRLKKLPNFDTMPIKKKPTAAKKTATLGPKAKLMKLAVTTLRNKAKKLGISDVSKRTKENLVQSIILGEARKKRGTAAGKKATAKRAASSTRQTGSSSTARDRARKALAPGRRVSKTGRVYYERRKNRSDKPGMLAGEKYQGWTNYWTWRWALEMIDEDYLYDLAQEYDNTYDLGQQIKDQAEEFVSQSIGDTPFESWMYAVLGDINWTEIAANYLGE
jgi:hypothetical protein